MRRRGGNQRRFVTELFGHRSRVIVQTDKIRTKVLTYAAREGIMVASQKINGHGFLLERKGKYKLRRIGHVVKSNQWESKDYFDGIDEEHL